MTRLVSKESKKRKRFAELGIDYEFPGYAALKSVEQDKTEKIDENENKHNTDEKVEDERKSKKRKIEDSTQHPTKAMTVPASSLPSVKNTKKDKKEKNKKKGKTRKCKERKKYTKK